MVKDTWCERNLYDGDCKCVGVCGWVCMHVCVRVKYALWGLLGYHGNGKQKN